MRNLIAGLWVFAVVALSACGRTPVVETRCNGSVQCPLDRVCVEDVCVVAPELTIITESLPNARIGVAYEASIDARGGQPPFRFSIIAGSGLPAGLTLAEDGAISGTPQSAGSATFTAVVRDAIDNEVTRELQLVVDPESGSALRVVTAELPPGTVDTPYTATLTAEGGAPPYVWTVASGVLPSGVVLSASGELSGTPISAGSAQLTLQVTDSASPPQVAVAQFEVVIQPVSGTVLAIETATLPDGDVGLEYAAQLAASGGTEPYEWSIATGTSLPSGLTLSSNGVLYGTPTQSGGSTFTVQVSDGSGPAQVATRQLSISIGAGALAIQTATLPNGQVGQAYSANITASGGSTPHSFSIASGALPPGMQLSQAGTLSGTPSGGGTFGFTVQATDSSTPAQVATRAYQVAVLEDATSTPLQVTTTTLPGATAGQAYLAQLAASGGTAPYAWSLDAASALPPGLALSTAGELSGTPATGGQYTFTVTAVDSGTAQQSASASLSLTVTAAGSTLTISTAALPDGTVGIAYTQQLQATGGTSPYIFTVAAGALPAGLSLSTAGALTGTPTTAGGYSFTVEVTDASMPLQSSQKSLSLNINAAPGQLAITTGGLPAATVNKAYSQQLAAAGGTTPYTWSIASGALPAGLTLSAGGVLSGTPTVAGSYSFVAEVADTSSPQLTATKQLTLSVIANPGSSLVLLTQMLPMGIVGNAYNGSFVAAGGTTPYTFSISAGALPPGLSLASDGKLSGTPTTSGGFSFTVKVGDASMPQLEAQRAYTMNISPGAGQLTITTQQLPPGRTNVPYSAMLGAVNGTAPYSWSITAGALPAGLTLSATGSISGTPTAVGTSSFTVQVSDASMPAKTATKAFSLRIR